MLALGGQLAVAHLVVALLAESLRVVLFRRVGAARYLPRGAKLFRGSALYNSWQQGGPVCASPSGNPLGGSHRLVE